MRHPDIGRKLLDGIAEDLKGTVVIERSPMMEGKMMSMIISRAPGWEAPKKQVPSPVSKKHHHVTPETTGEAATPLTPALVQENVEATVPPSE